MCTTRAAARRLNAAAAASLACDVPPCDTGGPDTAALAAHSDYYDRAGDATPDEPVRRLSLPELATDPAVVVFALMHVVALLTPWLVGRPTWRSAALVFASYTARMFGITAGFHRLLSHRSFATSRVLQFLLAWLGTASLQKGPIWWCSHHRHHHRTADTPRDAHSPVAHGFWWSHCGWFLLTNRHVQPLCRAVPDLTALPEMRWLERHYLVPPATLAAGLFAAGGARALAYGFFVATVLCWHATYCINSVAHLFGSRRFTCEFNGGCTARNNLVLALLTLGEGWHNNHHRFMASARHGFVQPWEIDVTFYAIKIMERVGLVWGVRGAPPELLAQARRG